MARAPVACGRGWSSSSTRRRARRWRSRPGAASFPRACPECASRSTEFARYLFVEQCLSTEVRPR
eukprot:6541264-Lingulodinium_polyedra.AAC.1